MKEYMEVQFKTRWPMRQTGDTQFVIDIPMGTAGPPVINPEFTRQFADLNDHDLDAMARSALMSIAIVKGQ